MPRLGGVRVAVVAAAAALVCTACWPAYGWGNANTWSNPLESKISPATAPTLGEVWRHDGVDGSTSTPAVFGDTAYFGSWDGWFRAVDLDDGGLRWETQLTSGTGEGVMVDASPRIHGSYIFIGDGEGSLHALDRTTGDVRWSAELDSHPQARIFGSAQVVDGKVIVGVGSSERAIPKSDYTFRGSLVALDVVTGDEVWRRFMTDGTTSGAGVPVWSTPAIDATRGLVYIRTGSTYESPRASLSNAFLTLDLATGEIVGVRPLGTDDMDLYFPAPPQGHDLHLGASPSLFSADGRDLVGIGDRTGLYVAVDRTTGAIAWARTLSLDSRINAVMATAAVADEVVYVTAIVRDGDHDLTDPANTSATFALDARDGSTIWHRNVPSATFGALTHANGVLYQPTVSGVLYAFDASDGSTLWSEQLDEELGGGVSVSDGTVLVPYGFWFYGAPADPGGGIAAFTPAGPLPTDP